ncbi:hypothetical protein C8J57DRAFT_1357903, partial [Mycena rebaudengoi]
PLYLHSCSFILEDLRRCERAGRVHGTSSTDPRSPEPSSPSTCRSQPSSASSACLGSQPRARLYRDCAAAASCSRPSSRCSPSTSPSLSPHRLTPPSRCSTTPSPPLPSAPHLPTHARRADTGILRLPCYQPERVALAAPEEACEHWLERAAVSV